MNDFESDTTLDISDDELEQEALAADPNPPLDHACPITDLIGDFGDSTLPAWYMPAVMRGGPRLRGWRRGTVFAFIAALLAIEAAGLCSTYGQIL